VIEGESLNHFQPLGQSAHHVAILDLHAGNLRICAIIEQNKYNAQNHCGRGGVVLFNLERIFEGRFPIFGMRTARPDFGAAVV
jgi:hypothetical protein